MKTIKKVKTEDPVKNEEPKKKRKPKKKKYKKKNKKKPENSENDQHPEKQKTPRPIRWFIIQFVSDETYIVQSMVLEEDLFWPSGFRAGQRQALYTMRGYRHLSTVLYFNENKDLVRQEFEKLKVWSYDLCCTRETYSFNTPDDPWMLVQYVSADENVIYTIINRRNTRFHARNRYNYVVEYLKIGRVTYLTLVLMKSRNHHEVQATFNCLRNNGDALILPLRNLPNFGTDYALPPRNFRSSFGLSALYETGGYMLENSPNGRMLRSLEEAEQETVASGIHRVKVLRIVRREV